ncbi:MAG: DUF72 domain-containing protein [Deltaproteobacteria bacterium]|nr:DUF72 domain-containing protein [Deltaproteobacteria bacterium]
MLDDISTTASSGSIIRIGCAGLPSGVARASYFERLDLLEVDMTFYEPPSEAALRRWRKEAPSNAGFSMLAWQVITHEPGPSGYERLSKPIPPDHRGKLGFFRDTDEVRDAWQRTLGAARALQAEVIVFQTPPSFSPSEVNRGAMRRFFSQVIEGTEGIRLAWEPRGLWEPEQAVRFAEELGIIAAFDPLQIEGPIPEADQAYFRLHGLGLFRNKISDEKLDELAEIVEEYERALVLFANVEKYPDAQRFRKLLASRAYVEEQESLP